jgi:hypothetical protein
VRRADDAFPLVSRGYRRPSAADVIYASMAEMPQQLISVIPGRLFLSQDGRFAYVTSMPTDPLNSVRFEK